MDDNETLQAIGRLIEEGWKARYPSRRQFALALGIDQKTVMDAEKGKRALAANTQRIFEKSLGWRKGSIEDVWKQRIEIPVEHLTLAEMERGAEHETWEDLDQNNKGSDFRASQLHDEEIIAELMFRLRNYKDEVARLNRLLKGEF